MSDDKSQEYFADGMTEDIITGLSCDSRLFMIARNSTFAYKDQSPDIRAVGKELGVRELAPTLTGQYLEDLWRHMLRHREQAETRIALSRQVWRE